MAKITSWFKEISTKLTQHPEDKTPSMTGDRNVSEESAPEKPVQENLTTKKSVKGQKVIKQIRHLWNINKIW